MEESFVWCSLRKCRGVRHSIMLGVEHALCGDIMLRLVCWLYRERSVMPTARESLGEGVGETHKRKSPSARKGADDCDGAGSPSWSAAP